MSEMKYSRYESEELIKWKKLSSEKQIEIVNEFSNPYAEKLKIIQVNNQSIKVELLVSKEEIYNTLVEYETYLRKKLQNIPIIILLQEKNDANKKRK